MSITGFTIKIFVTLCFCLFKIIVNETSFYEILDDEPYTQSSRNYKFNVRSVTLREADQVQI